jgi:hypothetical protein
MSERGREWIRSSDRGVAVGSTWLAVTLCSATREAHHGVLATLVGATANRTAHRFVPSPPHHAPDPQKTGYVLTFWETYPAFDPNRKLIRRLTPLFGAITIGAEVMHVGALALWRRIARPGSHEILRGKFGAICPGADVVLGEIQ